ncbi:MAG: hypothetical protein BYD32DRAFT_467620 [Podila humilis]|nr:MAG: hypothetical protein BYD32DRAFT_467620 [Podila humilis]
MTLCSVHECFLYPYYCNRGSYRTKKKLLAFVGKFTECKPKFVKPREKGPKLRRVQQQLHYSLAANGDPLVPDRSYYVQELANATGEAKKEAIPLSKTRKNSRKGAAATRPPEGTMMVCFGVAGNPTRIRLFKYAVTCDVSGWTILYVFQAIRNYYACPFLRLFTGGNVVSWGSVRVVNVGSMINQYSQHCMRIHVAFQGVPMAMLLIPLNVDFGAHAIRAGLTKALDEVSIQDMTFTPS